METENWINEILNSTNGMAKIVPDDSLFFKIQNNINTSKNVSNRWIWIAAASFTLLLSLNINIIYSKSNKSNSSAELIISSISKTNQLY